MCSRATMFWVVVVLVAMSTCVEAVRPRVPETANGPGHTSVAAMTVMQVRNSLLAIKGCPDTAGVIEPSSLKERVLKLVGQTEENAKFKWPQPVPHHDPWNDPEAMRRAFRPFGHAGARKRLREKLQHASSGGSLNVLVLGGSMPSGHGCPGYRYSEGLQNLLQSSWRQANVVNLALPGTRSQYIWTNLDVVANEKPDLVFVDYAINDGIAKDDPEVDSLKANTSEFEAIVKMAKKALIAMLSLPSKPAVVFFETFTHTSLYGFNCRHRVDEFPHWPALVEMAIPVVSYSDAVCKSPDMKNVGEFWDGAPCNGEAHPNCWVHRAISYLLSDFIHHSAAEASQNDEAYKLDHPPMSLTQEEQQDITCALSPLTKYVAKPENQGGSESLFPAFGLHQGWKYQDDSTHRPGWIAQTGNAHEISFEFKTAGPGGLVLMEYLNTYEGFGTLKCWFDNDSSNFWRIDALIKERVSLSNVTVKTLPAKHASKGVHKISCRSDGAKFKLSSLRSC